MGNRLAVKTLGPLLGLSAFLSSSKAVVFNPWSLPLNGLTIRLLGTATQFNLRLIASLPRQVISKPGLPVSLLNGLIGYH